MEPYFDNFLNILENDKSQETLLKHIINPLSPYLLCDHFFGKEIYLLPEALRSNKTDLRKYKCYNIIKDYDIVHCQNIYLERFINEALPNINAKIFLITSQMDLPQIIKNEITDKILTNDKILLWISQNPIYDNSEKYIAFPYGIKPCNLKLYTDALIYQNKNPAPKTTLVGHMPLRITHECRTKLPKFKKKCSIDIFYRQIAKSYFLLSPIGDRDDCYRHYECIGLGTIPISNIGQYYQNIFGTNMCYSDIDKMVIMLDEQKIDSEYQIPNKNLICFEYYKNIILKKILKIKENV